MAHNTVVDVKITETEAQAQDLQNALESGREDIKLPVSGEKGWGHGSVSPKTDKH